MNVATRYPVQLVPGDHLILGQSTYKVEGVEWDTSVRKYAVTYSSLVGGPTNMVIMCRETDELGIEQ